jgi:phosphoglycolate phosphatase-like HAD superfamily hydrolase
MAQLRVNGRTFSTRLIAFDKDGTLIDFHHLWGQKTRLWVAEMVKAAAGDDDLGAALYSTLGFSTEQDKVVADGPVAVAANATIYAVAAAVLYQHGLGWTQAESVARQAGAAIFGALPTADLIRPIGNVAQTIKRLAGEDIRIVIITSDDQASAAATVHHLGIADYVDMLVGGDDPLLPNKPDPASLRYISQQFDVELAQILMVGDTESDMIFGRNAGIGGCIGVVGGAGDEHVLGVVADALIPSIEAIQIDRLSYS